MEKKKSPWRGRLLVVAFFVVVFVVIGIQQMFMDKFFPLQKTDPRDKPLAACISTFISCNGGGCSDEFATCITEVTKNYKEMYGRH